MSHLYRKQEVPTRSRYPGKFSNKSQGETSLQVAGVDFTSSVETKMVQLLLGCSCVVLI